MACLNFLNSTTQLANIDWDLNHLWDLQFPKSQGKGGAPKPFDEWFPAISVTYNVATVTSMDISGGISTYPLPIGTTKFSLSFTFIDNVDRVLSNWLEDWMNITILNEGKYLSTLSELVKPIQIIRLDKRRELNSRDSKSVRNYLIYPDGAVDKTGSSDLGLPIFTLQAQVVGSFILK